MSDSSFEHGKTRLEVSDSNESRSDVTYKPCTTVHGLSVLGRRVAKPRHEESPRSQPTCRKCSTFYAARWRAETPAVASRLSLCAFDGYHVLTYMASVCRDFVTTSANTNALWESRPRRPAGGSSLPIHRLATVATCWSTKKRLGEAGSSPSRQALRVVTQVAISIASGRTQFEQSPLPLE